MKKYLAPLLEVVIALLVLFVAISAGNSFLSTAVVFIVILGLLVFVHELGHFVMAKRAGMRVDEFAFGFGPKIFGVQRGETLYSINIFPLGGYVKIQGEDGADSSDPRNFSNKTFLQRFLVLIAGVTMNAILAWVLLSIAMGIGIPTVISEGEELPQSAKVQNVAIGVLEVAPDSPASVAGLKPGDTIVKIGNEPIDSIDEMQSLTQLNAGKETVYEIKRGSEVMQKTLTPRANPPEGQGALGIALGSIGRVSFPWYEALFRGFNATWNLIVLTVSAFGTLIGQLFQGQSVGENLAGPIGIAVLTRDVTALGFVYLLQFTAVLSINLAIINAVPFPALDGGRILFLIIEKLRRKKLNVKAEYLTNAIGFMLLILLMIFVTVKDVTKYGDGFKRLFQSIF